MPVISWFHKTMTDKQCIWSSRLNAIMINLSTVLILGGTRHQ